MLLFLLALAQAATPATYAISGTVVEHLSNRPLNHVLVTIASVDQKIQLSFVTAEDGRFGFTNLPPGKYSLSAQKGSGQPQLYQQNDQFSTFIATGPGLSSESIVFPFEAPALLSGTVLDGDGDPVRNAQIWLFRKGVAFGRMQSVQSGHAQTDSSGTFHFAHLRPGAYLVAVVAIPWYAQNRGNQLDVAYPTTYYGDSTDAASASPLPLAEGGSATIQITLRVAPAVHVTLTGNSRSNERVNTAIIAEGPGGFPLGQFGIVNAVNDRQELTGVAPGHYVLQMQGLSQQGSPEFTKRVAVELNDNSTVSLQDVRETSVSGQLNFDGAQRPTGDLFLEFSCPGQDFQVNVAKDGTFNTKNESLRPGHCEVALVNAPGFYVKSVAIKGRKASTDSIEVTEGSQLEMTIVAAQGGLSQVQGIALKDGQPFAGAMVLLLPQDLSRRLLISRDQSDSDGTFTLTNIRPGRYTLVAIDDGRDLAYQDPLAMKAYLGAGSVVEFPLQSDSPLKATVLARQF
jgi:uncharacterized protein (DUF2141 family)